MRVVTAAMLAWVTSVSCGHQALPDPRLTAQSYADAVARGDARALHALLDRDSRKALSVREIQSFLDSSKPELEQRARALAAPEARVQARARVSYAGERTVQLAAEDGVFRVSSDALVPGGARSPTDALTELRTALEQRSYLALAHVLTSRSREQLERLLQSLTKDLRYPDALDVAFDGETATVTTPGGHRVELVREDGLWKIRDFE